MRGRIDMMFPKNERVDDYSIVEECKKEYCEVCGANARSSWKMKKGIPQIIDPHHIYTKGSGGPCIKENLIQLCKDCHYVKVPAGKYSKDFLLSIVSKREGLSVEEIKEKINRLRYGG